jgi:transposase
MRSSSAPDRRRQRARVLSMAGDGMPNTRVASVVGVSGQTVVTLRSEYAKRGLDVLADMPVRVAYPQWMKQRWW